MIISLILLFTWLMPASLAAVHQQMLAENHEQDVDVTVDDTKAAGQSQKEQDEEKPEQTVEAEDARSAGSLSTQSVFGILIGIIIFIITVTADSGS